MLFGNSTIDPNFKGIETDLNALKNSPCIKDQAIFDNLRIDDRVQSIDSDGTSNLRANKFYAKWNSSSGISVGKEQVLSALIDLSKEAADDFQNSNLNGANIISSLELESNNNSRSSQDPEFVTIKRIPPNFKKELCTWHYKKQLEVTGDDLSGDNISSDDDFNRVLKNYANSIASSDNSGFYQVIAQIFNNERSDRNKRNKRKVSWGTLRREFEKHADKGARFWLGLVGLGHYLFPNDTRQSAQREWFIVFTYGISDVDNLARPTVLEAGDNPWHYPTPAARPANEGGRTMLIDEARRDSGTVPMTEFIHSEINFNIATIWKIDDALIALRSQEEKDNELLQARRDHEA